MQNTQLNGVSIRAIRNRRRFLSGLGLGAMMFAVKGAYAEELFRTPAQTEGPFYPDKLPLDTDNDLIIINDSLMPAAGEITYLTGKILDAKGNPVRNALVEIWQVDHNAVYIHSKDSRHDKHDGNFQGFGRFMTGSTGEYCFRTIKPVPYPGRTAHIHFALKMKGKKEFITQCYVEGEPKNEEDGILQSITDPRARKSIIIPFSPMRGSRIGELTAKFDIVLGFTPEA